jgi:site-specific recombinase XerC
MPYLSPPKLTRAEEAALLRVSGVQPHDQVIFSLALGTGLRLSEIVGLDAGDVFAADGRPRSRIRLRKEIAKGGRAGDVFLPDALAPKLTRFWGFKVRSGESLDPRAPILCNQSGHRISKRRVQMALKTWQERAGFDRIYGCCLFWRRPAAPAATGLPGIPSLNRQHGPDRIAYGTGTRTRSSSGE